VVIKKHGRIKCEGFDKLDHVCLSVDTYWFTLLHLGSQFSRDKVLTCAYSFATASNQQFSLCCRRLHLQLDGK